MTKRSSGCLVSILEGSINLSMKSAGRSLAASVAVDTGPAGMRLAGADKDSGTSAVGIVGKAEVGTEPRSCYLAVGNYFVAHWCKRARIARRKARFWRVCA